MEISPEHDERVMKIVAEARQQPPAERESFLRHTCDTAPQLYAEIADTLKWEDRMGSFLREPLIARTVVSLPFQEGQVVEHRFEIVRIIGEGGMGVVYEAIDRKRNLRIAIKSAKPGFQRLLSPELEGALKVRHPNICLVNQIHTAKINGGEVDFLTMEFLQGETLSAHLAQEGKLEPAAALEVARQLCAGLSEAHRSGVIHGDLKSANIMLCSEEDGRRRVVITDFGLAWGANQTSGVFGGTPDYMAPELSQAQKPSKASDIYALGVILYEVATGRLPFDSKSGEDRPKLPAAPSAFAKSLDARWDGVILDCLSESPLLRPTNAAQILSRLEKRPLPKAPLIALALIAVAGLVFGGRIFDHFVMPAPVRLAVLPFQGPSEATVIGEGALQDVADRLQHLPSARRTLVVISPEAERKNRVRTTEEASKILNATHALQISLRHEDNDYVAEGSVIDLSTHAHLRDFSARYSSATVGAFPSALAGEVSLALRLRSSAVPEVLSPAGTAPYDKGLYLLRTDHQTFQDAITLFREAARIDPRSPLPRAALVEAQITKFGITKEPKCIEEAQQALREAESLNPDSARVRLAAGALNERAGQYEKALEDYRRVRELEPRNVDALLRIASVYDKSDMPDKAIEAYKQAIQLDPKYFEPYEDLGEFYYYRGHYPEAAEQFQNTITRAPGMFDAYTNLGAALDNLGRDAEAEQALLASLSIRVTARALNSMGAMRAYQKRDVEAVRFYEKAVALDPQTYLYFFNLGDSDRRLGRVRDAKIAYRKAMDLALLELKENPKQGYTRAFVGYLAARLGDRKRAENETTQAVRLSPADNEVIRCAVLTYVALGQLGPAFIALREATPELLRELDRQPDLADFRQDSRFQELVVKTTNGG